MRRLVHPLALAAFALAAVVAAGRAGADETVEALGTTPVTAGNTDAARARALDEACRQAVDQAVAAAVGPAARETHADAIRKRILRRARTYIVQYRVLDEGETDNVYHVRIEATVSSAALLHDLRPLGLAPAGADGQPAAGPPPRPRVLLLAVTRHGGEVMATFGDAQPGPAAEALRQGLATLGFEVVLAPGQLPPVSGGAAPGMPVDDGQAAALAAAVQAGVVVVVGLEITDTGPLRGTRQIGAEARAAVRVLDLGARSVLVAGVPIAAAGYGDDAEAAARMAGRAAAERAAAAVAPTLASRWPATPARGVTVRVRGPLAWPAVSALTACLAHTPGVDRVVARAFARGEVRLLVEGVALAPALADALRASRPLAARLVVRTAVDRLLELEAAVPAAGEGP